MFTQTRAFIIKRNKYYKSPQQHRMNNFHHPYKESARHHYESGAPFTNMVKF